VLQTQHVLIVLQKIRNDVALFQISRLRVCATTDNSELDLLQQFAFEPSPLPKALPCVFQSLTGLQDELERYTMGFAWLLVEVEAIDRSIIVHRVDLLIRYSFGIERDEFIHPRDAEVFRKLSVHFSGMNLVQADKLCCLIVEIELLLNAGSNVSNDAILGNKYVKLFLEQMLVNAARHVRPAKKTNLLRDALAKPCKFDNLFGFIVS
jgi:hypothetical protein